jgi:SOS response regulatory protein OraA/RecX
MTPDPKLYSALLNALKMLKRQDLTIQEVSIRLACDFEPDLVQETVQFLTEHHLLDDLRYARNAVERNEGKRAIGDQALRDKLESRGVPSDVIGNLMLEVDQDEMSRAVVLVDAKFSGLKSSGRVARFLSSRGFSDDTIESILARLGDEAVIESD